jgi:hypothetical protein
MYDSFRNDTNEELTYIRANLGQHDDYLGELSRRMMAAERSVDGLTDDQKKCATRADTRSLARELESHTVQLSQCASRQEQEQVNISVLPL